MASLRARTGSPLLECKRALEAAEGDEDSAAATLRERGLERAAGRAGRATFEGIVGACVVSTGGEGGASAAGLAEVNVETDFAARGEGAAALAARAARAAVAAATGSAGPAGPADADADGVPPAETAGTGARPLCSSDLAVADASLAAAAAEVSSALGERVAVPRGAIVTAPPGGSVHVYCHGGLDSSASAVSGRLAAAVALAGGSAAARESLGRRLAMHVASRAPPPSLSFVCSPFPLFPLPSPPLFHPAARRSSPGGPPPRRTHTF